MIHTKTISVPAPVFSGNIGYVARDVIDYISCDFCGVTIKSEIEEVMIEHFGIDTRTIFDCCPVCWKLKVMPAIKALGSGPRIKQREF